MFMSSGSVVGSYARFLLTQDEKSAKLQRIMPFKKLILPPKEHHSYSNSLIAGLFHNLTLVFGITQQRGAGANDQAKKLASENALEFSIPGPQRSSTKFAPIDRVSACMITL